MGGRLPKVLQFIVGSEKKLMSLHISAHPNAFPSYPTYNIKITRIINLLLKWEI